MHPKLASTARGVKRNVGRPRHQSQDVRQDLLDALRVLLFENPTQDPSLNDIAKRGGATAALITYYFGGKDGIMSALLIQLLSLRLEEELAILNSQLTPAQKIRAHIASVIRARARAPFIEYLSARVLAQSTPVGGEKPITDLIGVLMEAGLDIIREGMECGDLRPMDPIMARLTIHGACDHLFTSASAVKRIHDIDAYDPAVIDTFIEHTTAMLLSGMLAKPGLHPATV